jgi:phage/plasmid-associated DNA primase
VLAYLNLLVTKESAVSDANLIAFKNGVLDIVNDTFSEFSPEYIITNKIPHMITSVFCKILMLNKQIVESHYRCVLV